MNRDDIIKALEVCATGKCHNGCPYDGLLVECVPQLKLDAAELLKEQGWISVNDRLPNCNGCYLVWRPRFYIDKGMPSICYFDGQNTWHDSYGVDFTRTLKPEDVSHWKPLPEQP